MKIYKRWIIFFALLSLAIVVLAACGGGGSSSGGGSTANTSTLSGSVVKGPITGAIVTFYALNADGSKGAVLGTTTTDAAGNFTITLTPAPATPFLAQSSGGNYVDEATGATSTLLTTDVLSAVLPAGTTRATITPLTNIAAARALALAASGTPSSAQLATAVDSSNAAVAQQYNIDNIVTTLPPPANDAARMATATLAERQYALVLAGIAQNASTLGVRPIDLAAALATDAKDGLLNGTNSGAPINVPLIAGGTFPLPAIAGTTNIQTAINAFIASANNKSGQTLMRITLTPVQLGINTAGAMYTTSAVLPAAIAGQAYTAGVTATGGTPPYTCAVKAGSTLPAGYTLVPNTCQITGTGALLGGGTTMTISPPFTITITDSATPKASVDLTLHLTTMSTAPTITVAPAVGTVGLALSAQVAQATGGTPPYSFRSDSFANGAPPLGTIVDLNGVLKGTPAAAGTYTFGVCVVDLIGASSCKTTTATINPAGSVLTLSVTKAGTGSGTVASSPAGIACGATCSDSFTTGASVTLTATPDAGSVFTGWSGACQGTGACVVMMDAAKAVTANFQLTQTFVGSYSGLLGTATGIEGCGYSYSVSGTITLTLSKDVSGNVTGTGSVDSTRNVTVTYTPYNTTCSGGSFSYTSTGPVTGTIANISGNFSDGATVRPFTVVFTGAWSGSTIAGSGTVSKTAYTTGTAGNKETPMSATFSNLTLTLQ